jgi:hypothetical protein
MPDFDIDKAFYFLLTLMFITFFYFLERIYRTNKKWLLWVALFPPACIIFAYKYWEQTRTTCFFFGLFYALIIALELISGMPVSCKTIQIFSYIFVWQYYLYKLLITHHLSTSFRVFN